MLSVGKTIRWVKEPCEEAPLARQGTISWVEHFEACRKTTKPISDTAQPEFMALSWEKLLARSPGRTTMMPSADRAGIRTDRWAPCNYDQRLKRRVASMRARRVR